MRKFALAVTSISILVIAGCGETDDAGGKSGSGNSDTNTATAGWNAADACSLLDKAAVGAALGDKVTEASLGLVNQASGPNAATSECTYLLESGGRASLMTRNSPIADNTPEAIALARNAAQKTVAAFTDKKIEDIPSLGIAASFVPGINQLNVYIDDKRFVILTISSAPNAGAKAMAVDLFRKIKS
jgi:hypothetical protein